MGERSSTSSSAFAKLAGPKDLPRFSKEINGQIQEKFRDIAPRWMAMTVNIRAGRIYDQDIAALPEDPGARPVLNIPDNTAAQAARDLKEDYKLEVETWKYNKDLYEKFRTQSIGLFGFIMNHLEFLPANKVRRHTDFESAETRSDFGLLWTIILNSHQMTGAAKIAENLRIQNELMNIKLNKDESIDGYCHRFDELLTQVTLTGLMNDGPEAATAFMKGLINTRFQSLAFECLSASIPLEDSSQAIERARNYQALIDVRIDDVNEEFFAAASSSSHGNKYKKKKNKSSTKISNKNEMSEAERFKIGRDNYMARKKNGQVTKKKKTIRCYECGNIGHFAKDCKVKRTHLKQETASNATDNQYKSDSDSNSSSDDDDDENDNRKNP